MMMRAPAVLVVPPGSPHASVPDLVKAAKAQPGKLNFAAGSAGYQLMGELFNDMAGVNTMHVPYKGASEAIAGVASGTVDLTFTDITAAQSLIRAGKVRALAVATDRRVPLLPNVPTTAEAGLPGYQAYVWVGAMVAAKTPAAEAAKLSALLTQIARLPETREFYERQGAQSMEGGAQEMRQFQAAEIDLWKQIVVKAKVEQQ
jgi:tripartite-type tricarboxylate transporter receptor subunit TctC